LTSHENKNDHRRFDFGETANVPPVYPKTFWDKPEAGQYNVVGRGRRKANQRDHQIQSINHRSKDGLKKTTSFLEGLGVLKHRKACLLKY